MHNARTSSSVIPDADPSEKFASAACKDMKMSREEGEKKEGKGKKKKKAGRGSILLEMKFTDVPITV